MLWPSSAESLFNNPYTVSVAKEIRNYTSEPFFAIIFASLLTMANPPSPQQSRRRNS